MIRAEGAPAKLNLALHVTGQRDDEYHLLDSLVAFANIGDVVRLSPGPLSLTVTGPFAGDLPTLGNLCLRAAELAGTDVQISLTKNLPVASGIGGGSADAAAVLRGLARMGAALVDGATLGADVPVCVASRHLRMRGIGDRLDEIPAMPALSLVLVNPGVQISTAEVFHALPDKQNPALPPMPAAWNLAGLTGYLGLCRNDLQPPAINLVPPIGAAIDALMAHGALLARMSGSGATCFGIFANDAAAERAASCIGLAEPGWWAVATGLAPPPCPL